MFVAHRLSRSACTALLALILAGSTGCPAVSNRPAPAALLTQRDPELNRPYYLYVPTRYHDNYAWPLVITCHGTNPFDSASFQITEWKGLAEEKGFIVAAPELIGTTPVTISPAEQLRRQQEDEAAILSIVSAIRAARRVDDTRIFLTGWSAGGYAVLYTGLRQPDTFRALAIRQGNFNPAYLEPCTPFIDRYQPVLIMYGNIDLLKDDATACLEWLRGKDMHPDVLERAGAHRRDPEPVYSFFVDCVRHRPWIRIHVEDDPRDAMTVTFSARASYEPNKYLWDFGDEQRSPVAAPRHTYQRPGTYTVRLAVYNPATGKPNVRQVQLQVPRVRLGTRPPASTPAP